MSPIDKIVIMGVENEKTMSKWGNTLQCFGQATHHTSVFDMAHPSPCKCNLKRFHPGLS